MHEWISLICVVESAVKQFLTLFTWKLVRERESVQRKSILGGYNMCSACHDLAFIQDQRL